MKIIVDTCILSELRNPLGNPAVKKIDFNPMLNTYFISVITLGELLYGVKLLTDGKKKNMLANWIKETELMYLNYILDIDSDTIEIWADLAAQTKKKGHNISTNDLLIAATALQHNLHLMTINTKDFKALGVQLLSI